MLVQNTDKISKLYSKAFQAERDAAEVEKQISAVEGEQEELEQWLNKYEGEVEALLQKVGANDRNGTEGVDAERERTYKMAERLTDRIEGLNNDLKDVIEEVNGVSVTLGGANGNGGDDQVCASLESMFWDIFAYLSQLSQIVRVLNSHLQQLQVIDNGTAELSAKIAEAKSESTRLGGSMNGNGWQDLGSNGADDFYRSFRGGR